MDFESNSMSFIDFVQVWLQNTSAFDLILKGVLAYTLLFWLALIVWTARDVIHRSNNIIFQTFAILLNTFIPVFGLIIYLLLRPSKTLVERYYEDLEYKALSADQFCEKCSHPVNDQFDFCPECGNNLKDACNHCKRHSFVVYTICPYCGENKHDEAKTEESQSTIVEKHQKKKSKRSEETGNRSQGKH